MTTPSQRPWDWRISAIVDRAIRHEITSDEAAALIADLTPEPDAPTTDTTPSPPKEQAMTTTAAKYPGIHVQLTGEDGNAFSILGQVRKALRPRR
jgi:hypothetical protein